MTIDIVQQHALNQARFCEITQLCNRAYDEDITTLMQDFGAATHVLLVDGRGVLVSHALWIERQLMYGVEPLRSAYIELVATDPDQQHRGHATTVMGALAAAITGFDVGALSPSDSAFYARLGWQSWRGQLLEQQHDGLTVASPPSETVIVLQPPDRPRLDLDTSLTAPWRPGEIW